MKLSGKEFLSLPKKAVTFVGMSGVGKSYMSCMLDDWGWHSHSCDYLIGTDYLAEQLSGGKDMRADDIGSLSAFVGQVGDVAKGGLALDEFQRRQKLYYDAEVQSLRDACSVIDDADQSVIIDSSGSICEIEDDELMNELGARSLFVYLKVRQEGHGDILSRAVQYPKPLYFSPDFLLERLEYYKAQFDVESVQQIDPLEFLRWVFPFLFESRLPKYQALADAHGVTIYSDQFYGVKSEGELLQVIADALDKQEQVKKSA